jgi:mono/diheme cytochrome c family protein
MMKKISFILFTVILLSAIGCKKDTTGSGVLYTPTSADATSNATLAELQQGRTLYISNCGSCHGLYSPDDYSASRWRNIMSDMTPKTSMSSSEISLVTKYVTRGK